MKVQHVLVALSALLLPTHGAHRQCAGTGDDNKYEASGFLTADFTQKACTASGGSILPDRKGNLKCCSVPDAQQGGFDDCCEGQKTGPKFPYFYPTVQAC
ncbi:hypothetical protein ON010_g13103 [Phytophthora cinnamomi]|nr:hypothetical protein ON010_g13103 [Phytophthora cinnamomi]